MKDLEVSDGLIKIDLQALIEAMSKECQYKLFKYMAVQNYVLDKAIDYICGEDEDGWWTSDDDNLRMKLLNRIESAQIKSWSKYNWEFVSEAVDRLKEIREKQHIYWALYHKAFDKPDLWDAWSKFRKENNIEPNYTTKQADDDIERVVAIVTNAMENLDSKGVKSE